MKTGTKLTILFFIIYLALPAVSHIINRSIIWDNWCDENLVKFANTDKIRVLELHGEDLTKGILCTQKTYNGNSINLNRLPKKLEVSGDTLRMWLPRQKENYTLRYESPELINLKDLEYIFTDGRPARRAEFVEYTNPETGETSKAVQYSPLE